METFDSQLLKLYGLIDFTYLAIFLFLSYGAKKLVGKWFKSKGWDTVYIVFILATVLAPVFLIWTESTWIQILLTYALGTSCYQLAIKWIIGKVEGAFGKRKTT